MAPTCFVLPGQGPPALPLLSSYLGGSPPVAALVAGELEQEVALEAHQVAAAAGQVLLTVLAWLI